MRNENTFSFLIGCSLIIILAAGGSGCASDGPRQQREREFTIDVPEDALEDIARVKQVFYSLPSPLETAMILKSSGAIYNENLLNPVENSAGYHTNKSMALNLGIYITDLSYASLFDQTQTSMDYMEAARRLADNLGIIDAVDSHTIERLEGNINNREVIMDVVSETFMNSSSFLQENNREPVAALMLAGGWIEGLYLALNQVEENDLENNRLVGMIIDKKLSLDILMMMLDDNDYNTDVAGLIDDIEKIEEIFSRIDIVSSPIDVTHSESGGVSVLRSSSETTLTREVFSQLKSAVSNLRKSFVS